MTTSPESPDPAVAVTGAGATRRAAGRGSVVTGGVVRTATTAAIVAGGIIGTAAAADVAHRIVGTAALADMAGGIVATPALADVSGGIVGTAAGHGVPLPGANNRRSGLGDVSVALGYSFELGRTTWFDLSTRVKLPTASTAKRLGTGKVDVTMGGDLVQDLGNASFYAGGRYRILGKPAGSTLRNTLGLGGGASYRLPGGTIVGADYDWQQSATRGRQASSEVTGWVNFGLTRRLRMQVFASTGLNTNSTDFAGGLSLSYRLN